MKHVVACIDGTDVSAAVSNYAAWASRRMQAPLEFLHVLDKSSYPAKTDLSGNLSLGGRSALLDELAELDEKRGKLALQEGRAMLDEARDRAREAGIEKPLTLQRHGGLTETLTFMEERIRLVVLGKHKEHLHEHMGSRLENVIRTIKRPILVTTNTYTTPQQVMIAYDGSKTTRRVVELVADSPLFVGLPCHLVLVGEDNKANRSALDWAKARLEQAGFKVPAKIIPGEVERVLCAYRDDNSIDMLIMGAYGHSAIRRLLTGSTTTSIVRDAAVPVLLLR